LMLRRPLISTLFPYTTLFRSERGLLEGFRNGRAGIVHKHIKSAKGRDGLFDRTLDSFDVGSVRLDRDSLSAMKFNRFDHGGSRRSEEHTSELQSRSDLVCRLL